MTFQIPGEEQPEYQNFRTAPRIKVAQLVIGLVIIAASLWFFIPALQGKHTSDALHYGSMLTLIIGLVLTMRALFVKRHED